MKIEIERSKVLPYRGNDKVVIRNVRGSLFRAVAQDVSASRRETTPNSVPTTTLSTKPFEVYLERSVDTIADQTVVYRLSFR